MKTIGAFRAKTHLSSLLSRVAKGESFLITKRGQPMASLSPVKKAVKRGPKDDIMDFRQRFAKSLTKISPAGIAKLKNIGRK